MRSFWIQNDRRANRRYEMRKALLYRVAGCVPQAEWKSGAALDMSAGGIRVRLPEALPTGTVLELSLDWSGLYHDREAMRLHLVAAVTRRDERGTALRIVSHRFREAGARARRAVA